MSDEMSVKYDSLCAVRCFKLFIQVCSVARRSKMTEIRPTQRVLSIAASNAKNPVGLNDTIARPLLRNCIISQHRQFKLFKNSIKHENLK